MNTDRNKTVSSNEILNLVFSSRQIIFVSVTIFFTQNVNRLIVRAAQQAIIIVRFNIRRVNQHGDIFQRGGRQILFQIASVNNNIIADNFNLRQQRG